MEERYHVTPMKTIGILGGMSGESTALYYQLINDGVNRIKGGHNIAEILLSSVNFQNIENFIFSEQWDDAAEYLVQKARGLEKGGADFLLIATNPMHNVASQFEAAVDIPLIHIVDVTAEAILTQGFKTVGLLGTKPTMEAEFYKARFQDKFGIKVLVPSEADRERVNSIIFDELCHNVVTDGARREYLEIMQKLVKIGAEGIILGCTEIGMLIGSGDFSAVPLFDTTSLHTEKAVTLCLRLEG